MRNRLLSIVTLLVSLLCCSAASVAEILRLERAAIIDGTGFGQPMIAVTLFKPYGWKETGGVSWGSDHACTRGWGFNWSAEAADGLSGIGILPQQGWEQSSEGRPVNFDCPLRQLNGVEDYLRALVQHGFRGAQVVNYRARPDIAQGTPTPPNESINNGFIRQNHRVEAGEIIFDIPNDGNTVRSSLSTTVVITQTLTGGEGFGIGPPIQSFSFSAMPTFVFYTPVNAFEPALYEGIRRSVMPDQNWLSRITQHGYRMNEIDRKGSWDRSQISQKAHAQIVEMTHKAWQSNQRSSDSRAGDFVNAIREVQNYSDTQAPGGQVELSNQYNHAWRLEDGSYALTDDASFQPQQALGMSGQALSATP
jgi:hypothetical protein